MPTWCTRIKQPTRLLPLKIIKKEKACVRNFKLIFICLVYKSSKYMQQNWSRTNCFTNEKASDRVNKLEIVWIYKDAEDGDGVGMWAMPYFSTVQIERYIFPRLFSVKCFWSRTHSGHVAERIPDHEHLRDRDWYWNVHTIATYTALGLHQSLLSFSLFFWIKFAWDEMRDVHVRQGRLLYKSLVYLRQRGLVESS